MEIQVTIVKNIETQLYDVITTDSSFTVTYETICSCKSYENAEWIIEMIKKEK